MPMTIARLLNVHAAKFRRQSGNKSVKNKIRHNRFYNALINQN